MPLCPTHVLRSGKVNFKRFCHSTTTNDQSSFSATPEDVVCNCFVWLFYASFSPICFLRLAALLFINVVGSVHKTATAVAAILFIFKRSWHVAYYYMIQLFCVHIRQSWRTFKTNAISAQSSRLHFATEKHTSITYRHFCYTLHIYVVFLVTRRGQ